MKTFPKTIALLSGVALLASSAFAQSVATGPVGYKTVTIKGDEGLTLLGVEFLTAASYTGQVTGVGTNSVTVSGADFDALLESGKSYFLDLVDSATVANIGINTSIVSWSGSTLTIGDDLDGLLDVNADSIAIHELPTIGGLFGVGGDILAGGSATTADLIYMPNPDGAGLISVYYSTGGFAGVGWRQVGAGNADKNDLPIYFTDGLYVLKKSSGDVDMTLTGSVKMSSNALVVEEGFTPFSTVFPSGITFSNSGLYDAENPNESITSGSATTADLVYAAAYLEGDADADGQTIGAYYYSSGGFAGVGWRRVGAGNADMSAAQLGSGFGILKQSGSTVLSRVAPY